MVVLFTITTTLEDDDSLTNTEAHQLSIDIAKFIRDFANAQISATINTVTALDLDYSAGDALAIKIT